MHTHEYFIIIILTVLVVTIQMDLIAHLQCAQQVLRDTLDYGRNAFAIKALKAWVVEFTWSVS